MPHITYATRRRLGLCLGCLAPIPPGITRCIACRQSLPAKAMAKQWGLRLDKALQLVRERDKAKQHGKDIPT